MKRMIPYIISVAAALAFNLLVIKITRGEASIPLLILLDIPLCALVGSLLNKIKR